MSESVIEQSEAAVETESAVSEVSVEQTESVSAIAETEESSDRLASSADTHTHSIDANVPEGIVADEQPQAAMIAEQNDTAVQVSMEAEQQPAASAAVDAAEQAQAATTADEQQTGEAKDASSILVRGEVFTKLPEDLYIPPDALEVFLEAFEGPLDLLLYLIKRQNLDILDIPIATITHQYVEYVELMENLRLELAAEYLVMAASLAEIKSRLLLPRPVSEEGEEEDPRAELVRRLQEYERIKAAAEDLEELPRLERDFHLGSAQPPELDKTRPLPDVELKELILALKDVMKRVELNTSHHIEKEQLSVRERMTQVLDRLAGKEFIEFSNLFTLKEGKMGVVVSFIAMLELLRQSMIEIIQHEPYSPIHIRATST